MGKYISTPLQGLILRDDRFSYENLDLVNSSYSQASPEPDQPQPSAAGFMELQSLGDLSTAQSLDIQTVRAGLRQSGPVSLSAPAQAVGLSGSRARIQLPAIGAS
jgi:hypothetical protein